MKNKINKFIHSKYLLISLIVLLILLVMATGTYAWFTWRSTSNTSLTMNIGKLADVLFNSGNDISTSTLAPVYNYTDGEKTTFRINNKDTSGTTLSYSVKLNITSIASELKSTDLKYVLLKNDTIVQEGNFSTMVVGANTIYSNSISSSGTTNFTFYLYIDGNSENNLNMMNKSLVGTLSVEAAEKESFATYITNLYNSASKTQVTNNIITYQYDTTNYLMKDVGNNIRYYGASPNNYIYFNCSDYANQTSSTCEIWRIIGVFDGRLKLMRNESIGKIEYDNDKEDTYLQNISNYNEETAILSLEHGIDNKDVIINLAQMATGQNDYSKSSLQKILNNYYYNRLKYTGNSTYDFTSTGIKDKTKSLIFQVTYNLGGIESLEEFSSVVYSYERGTTVYSGNSTTWLGNIAIPYASDYGYAADFSKCSKTLDNYYDNTCASNNWMYSIVAQKDGWLLTHNNTIYTMTNVIDTADANSLGDYVYISCEVVPVLYLNSELSIKSGTGSSSDPYQLQVN